jgi:hypothetical protein
MKIVQRPCTMNNHHSEHPATANANATRVLKLPAGQVTYPQRGLALAQLNPFQPNSAMSPPSRVGVFGYHPSAVSHQ